MTVGKKINKRALKTLHFQSNAKNQRRAFSGLKKIYLAHMVHAHTWISAAFLSGMSDLSNIVQNQTGSSITLQGMGTQLAINVGIAIAVLLAFSVLLVYAPRSKYANKTTRPPDIGKGWFAWCKVIIRTSDDVLLEKIGYDAVQFIQFIRMLRQLMLIMTGFGLCVIMPLNIIATRFTGTWPPEVGVDFLSISTINLVKSKANLNWFWVHSIGTWSFSLIIYWHLFRHYHRYVAFRQQYFHSYEYQRSAHARTLIIFNVPSAMQSDEGLAEWISSMRLKYPFEQICIGRRNDKLAKAVQEHEQLVRKLEIVLSSYLRDGQGLQNRARPLVRLGGWWCCGGRKVDAIDHYTERIQVLVRDIEEMRMHIYSNKPTNYGWISFAKVEWAHDTAKHLSSSSSPLLRLPSRLIKGAQPRVELAPQPKDILWSNLALNEHVRNSKRLVVSVIYYLFVFFWFIPSSFLSASSNVKEFIRLFPNSDAFIKQNRSFIALLSYWFTPIVMAIFFLILPRIMRLLSQHQGSLTETSLDRQVFAKLYTFFIVNILLVFTIASTLIQMYTQIKSAAQGSDSLTPAQFFESMGSNLAQVAKNLNDVSTYWLSYVTLKSLGVIIDLAQLFVLISITLTKWLMNPSPRQLQELTRPSQFDYPIFFNLLIFFFTVGLIYSVISPLVLPFTLIYFILATIVFKYLLMYVFVTRTETGGQMWRILFNRLIVSVLLFQVVMIGILKLKSAELPAYVCVPLPIITVLFKMYCLRKLDPHVYYIQSRDSPNQSNVDELHVGSRYPSQPEYQDPHFEGATSLPALWQPAAPKIQQRYGDPVFFSELPVPMVHDKVRHLLPAVYGTSSQTQQKVMTSKLTRQKSVRHVSMLQMPGGRGLPFQSIREDELENDDCTEGLAGYYKFEQDDDGNAKDQEIATNIDSGLSAGHDPHFDALHVATPPPNTYTPQQQRRSVFGFIAPQRNASLSHPSSTPHDPYAATRPLMMLDDDSNSQLSASGYSDHQAQTQHQHSNNLDAIELDHLPVHRDAYHAP
ncbi:hypothetical protein BC940DRAFT_328497 [Gongronella butleri]|nr:hypothetical protein BC940DRAFT_328497 [Gongronella butleri]